ncbi:MAG: peptidoglycan-associated lipoprotein Pal [Alphaproteobacteria bacterium]|nr:peptidoglycan-associated lipoprotein Pal [Alphaproteobacteria bacterium]MDE1987926.1 peptidoglycan-associated lipoprotein Pal [Alphaproteobacteria bacterium]MDE2162515.1 peptidoglycan-associated lipoprotein Pal [Alphaproteobacteria bacterium]MDE2264850.1 peptidoglycan-associated lipoprotein Pal [Alphaproteobacteria bacterium]MDE2500971.1 peptidoglycan-associated lipoprotein Pal [Alphaproteobacteria bacterium]
MTKLSAGMKLAVVAFAVMLAGCETKPPPAPPPAPVAAPAAPTAPSIVPGSAEDLRVNVGDTVHFDYNKSAILEGDKSTLQRQATWLAKYPSVRVTIEGNCDERGTREYNLALGARRANAVKEYLISLGVSAARIDTISYGKERPICSESTEACWAQNRRAVTVIASGASS